MSGGKSGPNYVIACCVTQAELKAVQECASINGTTVSELVRMKLRKWLDEISRPLPGAGEPCTHATRGRSVKMTGNWHGQIETPEAPQPSGSTTHAVMGDPAPGRSAWDNRK